MKRSVRLWFVALTGAACCLAWAQAAGAASGYAVESVSASLASVQAGAHSDLTIAFSVSEDEEGAPAALTKDISIALPPGMVGNPQGFPRCSTAELGTNPATSECPQDSQVGVTNVTLAGVLKGTFTEPVFNMVASGPEVVARLGFFAALYPVVIEIRVDPIDYGLTASIEGAPSAAELLAASTTLWGVPAAESHNLERITPAEAQEHNGPPEGRKSDLPEAPFLSNPTSCETVRQISVTADSYQEPNSPSTKTAAFPTITGCGKLSFNPTFTVTPTNTEAVAPTGIEADFSVPQDETPNGRATSALKSANVLLPPGLTINPAAGDGLAACSASQVGFETTAVPECPDASKIGSAEIDVPALEHVLQGSVYQRTPEPGHLFRFWLVSDELGVHLKLPAEILTDPVTGQVRTIFGGIPALGGNPQVPVAEIKLHIFGGPRAPLSTPSQCGVYQTHYEFQPWSGRPPTVGDTAMQINSGCGKGGFSPKLVAGTLDPSAGRYSSFALELTRQDGEGNPSKLEVQLPEGLTAKLAGVPLCPDSAAATGNCPSDSQIGTAIVAAGVGSTPLWVPQPGKSPTAVYWAGPYKGGPFSLVVTVPAQAGPFDLGTVVTRAAVFVDPITAQVTATSDPLPQILEGVPITYRNLRIDVNRQNFMLNPTNCNAMQVKAVVTAVTGAVASPTSGFQATNCAALDFKPSLKLSLKGPTKRAGHPALKAVLTYPKKGTYANIGRVQVGLPRSEFLDQGNLNKVCTQPELRSQTCPKKSIYGHVKAWTPLLEKPLEGPVYLGVGFGYKLPALVVDLDGQIRVLLVGKVDTDPEGGIRNTFQAVPDAPVSRFVLEMKGGKKYGLLENSENICRKAQEAAVKFSAQNGKVENLSTKIGNSCKKKK
jgi:hypothetical protein